MIKVFFFFILLTSRAFACDVIKEQLNPLLKKKLDDYDKFIISLQSEKDPLKAINKRIKTHGLLLNAHINEKLVKNYPSSYSLDSISGARTIFLKNMKLPPGLSNDIVYEVAKPDSTKPIRSWQIPANETFQGVRGNELLHRAYLATPCSNFRRDVVLAISPKGSFRAVQDIKFIEPDSSIKCPAKNSIFKGSDYVGCTQFIDLKSKKKRIFIFQHPMT